MAERAPLDARSKTTEFGALVAMRTAPAGGYTKTISFAMFDNASAPLVQNMREWVVLVGEWVGGAAPTYSLSLLIAAWLRHQ